MTFSALLLRPASYWTLKTVPDQLINMGGGTLNLDLVLRVKRARLMQHLRAVGTTLPTQQPTRDVLSFETRFKQRNRGGAA